MGSDCLFCKIVAGEIPARRIYEDAESLAFADLNAQAPTHLLLVPKRHIASLAQVAAEDAALLGHLMVKAADLAHRSGLDRGFRLVVNSGSDGGQSVDHLHLHLLGGRTMIWPPG